MDKNSIKLHEEANKERLEAARAILAALDLPPTLLLEVKLINGNSNRNEYHNFQHLLTVGIRAYRLGQTYEALDKDDLRVLFIAGLTHDLAYDPQASEGVNIVTAVAKIDAVIDPHKNLWGYRKNIKSLVEATYFPHSKTQTMLEEIIQDADLMQRFEKDGELWLKKLEKENIHAGRTDFKADENFPSSSELHTLEAKRHLTSES